jgi:hypothetical protein
MSFFIFMKLVTGHQHRCRHPFTPLAQHEESKSSEEEAIDMIASEFDFFVGFLSGNKRMQAELDEVQTIDD